MNFISGIRSDFPDTYKTQIFDLLKGVWGNFYENLTTSVLDNTDEFAIILVDNNTVLSHVLLDFKEIMHKGVRYLAYGISEVVCNPAYQKNGYGKAVVQQAYVTIQDKNADIAVFTCSNNLVNFYTSCGFAYMPTTTIVGGTKTIPFRSDTLNLSAMMHFYSKKATENQFDFLDTDIFLDLGENKLW